MVDPVTYAVVGAVAALVLVTVMSYFDEGDNDMDAYMAAGAVGLITMVAWPLVVPFAVFTSVGWYVSENVGQ
jgi:hypothetical protein